MAPFGAFQCKTTASESNPQYKEKSLAYSSGFIMTGRTAAPASGWLFASAWLNVMEEESGSNPNLGKEQLSTSPDALLVREARAATDPDAPSSQVLLLDLNLSKVDGFEVPRRLRASAKFSDRASDRSRAAEFGAGYFPKPPGYEEFLKLGGALKQLLKDRGGL